MTSSPTSTVLPPSSDSGLASAVYIAVGTGGGVAVTCIACTAVSITLAMCVRSRVQRRKKKGNQTTHYTEGWWVHVFMYLSKYSAHGINNCQHSLSVKANISILQQCM